MVWKVVKSAQPPVRYRPNSDRRPDIVKTRFAAAKRPTSDRANPQQRAAGQSSRRHGPVLPRRPLHPGWAPSAGSGTCNARGVAAT